MFDPDEAQAPAIDAAAFERLQATLASRGAAAAVDELVAEAARPRTSRASSTRYS